MGKATDTEPNEAAAEARAEPAAAGRAADPGAAAPRAAAQQLKAEGSRHGTQRSSRGRPGGPRRSRPSGSSRGG